MVFNGRRAAFALATLAILLVTPWAQASSTKGVEGMFESDPMFTEVNRPINPGDANSTDTSIGEWRADFGTGMPNGTYYGTLLSPALFKHNFKPIWRNSESDPFRHPQWGYNCHVGTYVALTAHFNLSVQKIMAGASEWWMRLPVSPESIEADYGVTIAIFQGETDPSLVEFEDSMTYYVLNRQDSQSIYEETPSQEEVFPSVNGYAPSTMVRFRYLPGDLGARLEEGSAPNYLIKENRAYFRISGILEPNVDYLISVVFRVPIDGRLFTYWSTCEAPAGRETGIYVADVSHQWNTTKTSRVDRDSFYNVSMDLDWSFLFVEGVGAGGLFGKRVSMTPEDSILLRPTLNWSGGDDFLSFMVPFISDETAYVSPRIYNGFAPYPTPLPPPQPLWYFDGGDAWFNYPEGVAFNYTDYILFSSANPVDSAEFEHSDCANIAVELKFKDYCNLTLLCMKEDRAPVTWASMNGTTWKNSTTNPLLTAELWDNDTGAQMGMHYKPWISAYGTDGQWTHIVTNAQGRRVYTMYFPQEIHISNLNLRLKNETTHKNATYEELWSQAAKYWSEKHYLKALYYGIRAVGAYLWDGGHQIVGRVYDGLTDIWEGMKAVGQWIYTKLVQFFGWIMDFLEDAWDIIAHIWDSVRFIVAPAIAILILGVASMVISRVNTRRVGA